MNKLSCDVADLFRFTILYAVVVAVLAVTPDSLFEITTLLFLKSFYDFFL